MKPDKQGNILEKLTDMQIDASRTYWAINDLALRLKIIVAQLYFLMTIIAIPCGAFTVLVIKTILTK